MRYVAIPIVALVLPFAIIAACMVGGVIVSVALTYKTCQLVARGYV